MNEEKQLTRTITLEARKHVYTHNPIEDVMENFDIIADMNYKINRLATASLLRCGYTPNLSGYTYLKDAITEIVKHPQKIKNVTKGLYIEIAQNYNTNWGAVERSIRHINTIVFNSCDYAMINSILGTSFASEYDKPTSTQIIALFAESIRLLLEKCKSIFKK